MSNCGSCNICNEVDPVLEGYVKNLPMETSHNRMKQQETKCGFGLQGVCCKLCSNGPCRISPNRPKGVCGADADTIVARNFLRSIAAGSGCYIHIVENTARNLKELALAKDPIKGVKTLHHVAEKLGVTGLTDHDKALNVAQAVLDDLYKPAYEKMVLVEKLAHEPRFKKWKELGILPGGAKNEVFAGVVKTSTNLNSDPVNMLFDSLRLGISTGLYGLTLTNLLNDIITGEAQLQLESVGLKVIDPEYINVMLTGHEQSFFEHLQYRLVDEDVVARAKAVGAKGIKIVGCTCVGQDFQVRSAACSDAWCGHAGNNYTSEAVLLTGCIDMIVSEFNCTLPGIEPICDQLEISQVCLHDVAKKANAEMMEFSYAERKEISDKLVDKAIETYVSRKAKFGERVNPMAHHGNDRTLTGVTEVTLKEFLGGNWQPLIDLIVAGGIKGIAGIVGCSNLRALGHDVFTVELAKELIAKDILVLASGCACGGLENVGLMTPEAAEFAGPKLRKICETLNIPPVLNFGPCLAIGRMEIIATEMAEALNIDIPQLPLVLSAPQWLEEQALADGAFALALGLPLHLGLPPFVTGSPVVTDVLMNQLKDLTGGQLIVETDVKKSAEIFEQIIEEKRAGLNI